MKAPRGWAAMILEAVQESGRPVTEETALAEIDAQLSGELTYVEKHDLAHEVLTRHIAESRGEDPDEDDGQEATMDVLSGKEIRELGAEIVRRNPDLTYGEVYHVLVAEHGDRIGISEKTWKKDHAREARKAAGVGPATRGRRTAEAEKEAARAKELVMKQTPADDHPWRQRARAEVAEARASKATTSPKDKEADHEVATDEPSGERPGEATKDPAGVGSAEPAASPAPAGPVSSGAVASNVDGPSVLELSCPGTGYLQATKVGDGRWRVTYEGSADAHLLDDLVRALSWAVTGAGRDAA